MRFSTLNDFSDGSGGTMPATGRFSQTPPDRANDLFEKLFATSDSAVKSRERLLAGLKQELSLLASMQEEHLFPVLRQHGMQGLVRDAVNYNEATGALLTELEQMPKNSPVFLAKLAELKRVFQQHIRDDRKELLPAVLKVLGEKEAEAVVEKVEDEMAAMGEISRAWPQRSREQAEAVQRLTEDTADTFRASMESFQTVAQSMQEAMQNGFGIVSELTRRSTGQATQALSLPDSQAKGLSEQVSRNFRAIAQSGTMLAHGLQDLSHECFELSQRRLQRNLDGMAALTRCGSVTDFMALQSSLIRDNLEQSVENSRRIAELTIRMADEAARSVVLPAEKPAQRPGRTA